MATSAVDFSGRERFSISTVLSRAFGVMGNNPLATFGVAFLFGTLPRTLYAIFMQPMMIAAATGNQMPLAVISIASGIVFLIVAMMAQGAIVRATSAYAYGERASFADCVNTGLTMAVPLIGLTILMILGLMVGTLLLFIPGVILAIMWSVAAPALVTEKNGVFNALSRSRHLTAGARWKIFGFFLLMIVLFTIISTVSGIVMFAAVGVNGLMGAAMTSVMSVPYLLISAISGVLTTTLWTTTAASLYISLRNWKDGAPAETLAEIFS